MKKFPLLFLMFLLTFIIKSFGQNKSGKISGIITDESKKGIDGATVSLVRGKDASLVKVSVTDKSGYYEFEKIADGRIYNF